MSLWILAGSDTDRPQTLPQGYPTVHPCGTFHSFVHGGVILQSVHPCFVPFIRHWFTSISWQLSTQPDYTHHLVIQQSIHVVLFIHSFIHIGRMLHDHAADIILFHVVFIGVYWLYVVHFYCRYHLVIQQAIHVVHSFIHSWILAVLNTLGADITWLFNSLCVILFIRSCILAVYYTHSCSRYILIIKPFICKLFCSCDIHSYVSSGTRI